MKLCLHYKHLLAGMKLCLHYTHVPAGMKFCLHYKHVLVWEKFCLLYKHVLARMKLCLHHKHVLTGMKLRLRYKHVLAGMKLCLHYKHVLTGMSCVYTINLYWQGSSCVYTINMYWQGWSCVYTINMYYRVRFNGSWFVFHDSSCSFWIPYFSRKHIFHKQSETSTRLWSWNLQISTEWCDNAITLKTFLSSTIASIILHQVKVLQTFFTNTKIKNCKDERTNHSNIFLLFDLLWHQKSISWNYARHVLEILVSIMV